MANRSAAAGSEATGGTRRTDDDPTPEVFGGGDRAGQIDSLSLRPGDRVERYAILRELGRGGMSVVFVAYDQKLDREVALKVVRPGGVLAPFQSARRLHREAQALARLSHPNVVHVYDVGIVEQKVYIAMELVEGRTLAQWLKGGEHGWREILGILTDAGEGLAAAHEAGLVHFDFKPGNVLIGADGRVRVADFGLAREPRPSSESPPPEDSAPPDELSEPLTDHGVVMGTPGYIAPEHIKGDHADARADQFSFCVTFWQALHGKRPFRGKNHAQLRRAVLEGRLSEPTGRRRAPPWLQQILRRGLAVNPDDRYPTLRELLADLRRHAGAGRRRMMAAIGAAVVIAGVPAALALWPHGAAPQVDCERGRDRLAVEWNDGARAEARAAFAAVAVDYADAAWSGSSEVLDRYAEAWAAMHVDACEATHVRHEQTADLLDRRMACLQRRRMEFTAIVDLFRNADADLVRNAVSAAHSLAPVSTCAEAVTLPSAAGLPIDAEERRAIEAIEEAIARATALREAGKLEHAAREATDALEQAETLGHQPTVWSAANLAGLIYAQEGAAREGLAMHERALAAAEAAEMDYAQALTFGELAFVHGTLLLDFEESDFYSRSAHAVYDRIDASPRQRVNLLGNDAFVLTMRGRIDEALAVSRRAVGLRQETELADDTNYSALMGTLGGALYSAGRYEEALHYYQEAHRVQVGIVGMHHPALAVTYENLGNALQALGRFDEALEAHLAARNIGQSNGLTGPSAATQLGNIGVVLATMGRTGEARRYYREAIEMWTQLNPTHPVYGVALVNLAELDLRDGKREAARTEYERGLIVLEDATGKSHPWVAVGLAGLAAVLVEDGEYDRALELAERSLEIHRTTPTDANARAEAELQLGRALWETTPARRAEARALVTTAEAALAAGGSRNAALLRTARAWLRQHTE